jgi:RNA polymerase sigma-70 factor (ECF subfamily)
MTPDEDLFREWQQGAVGALEALVRRHHAPLLAHLIRLTGNPALAEDLTQDTFLRLVRDARLYHYPRPFLPWLYTIARNLALNHYRSAHTRHVESGAVPDTFATAPDPAEWVERWERREGLQQAITELTFEQREVLSLRFGQELSVRETAAVLGLPEGTVKSRTFNALRRLREAIAHRESAGNRGGGILHG